MLDMFLQSKICQRQTRKPLASTCTNKIRIPGLGNIFFLNFDMRKRIRRHKLGNA